MNYELKFINRKNKVGTIIPTLFLLFGMTITARSQSQSDSLTAYLHRLPPTTRVSLAVQSLGRNGILVNHRADERVPSASVIKLPIMLETMERVKVGKLNLDEIHVLTDAEKVGGSGVLQTYPDQSRVSYRELLRLMMVRSDNTATNIIISKLGRETINQRIRTIGLTKSQLNRVMMDTISAQQGRDNFVSAQDMNRLLEKVYRHQVATPELCNQMIEILKQNADTLCIPRLLPKSTVVAHKTGSLTYVRGDSGIVYAKSGRRAEPFLISIFVEGVPMEEAEQIIGEISLVCYTYFSR
ncbi:serine hydrolase [Spirosoma flavum]|uniref:beta-lactamase n=1 Tax=Spirosoma flavum TaxID=2048557 RepID=A0ABW6ABY6_9BACT